MTSTANVAGPFVIQSGPSLTPHGNDVTLAVNYTNSGGSTILANLYMVFHFANGTLDFAGYLSYPSGQNITAGGSFGVQDSIGPFQEGTYEITFYVTQGVGGAQISAAKTLTFTV